MLTPKLKSCQKPLALMLSAPIIYLPETLKSTSGVRSNYNRKAACQKVGVESLIMRAINCTFITSGSIIIPYKHKFCITLRFLVNAFIPVFLFRIWRGKYPFWYAEKDAINGGETKNSITMLNILFLMMKIKTEKLN